MTDHSSRQEDPPPRSRGWIKVDPDTLKPDEALLDRYIAFSSELLRLSLAAIAAIAFLIVNVSLETGKWPLSTTVATLSVLSLCCLGLSVGFALAHRYVATDALAYHVSLLRREIRGEREQVESERCSRNVRLKLSGWLLVAATVALGAGAVALIGTLSFIFAGQ